MFINEKESFFLGIYSKILFVWPLSVLVSVTFHLIIDKKLHILSAWYRVIYIIKQGI